MRSNRLPSLDAKVTPENASAIKRDFMISALNAKADWMERTMKPILPHDIYRMVWDITGTPDQIEHRREIVRKYLKSQDIRIEEHGLNARIMKGTQQIGQTFMVFLSEK